MGKVKSVWKSSKTSAFFRRELAEKIFCSQTLQHPAHLQLIGVSSISAQLLAFPSLM